MTPEQADELYKILETKVGTEEEPKEDVAKQLRRFMSCLLYTSSLQVMKYCAFFITTPIFFSS